MTPKKTIYKNILLGTLLISLGCAALFAPMVILVPQYRSAAPSIVEKTKNPYVEVRRSVVGIQMDGRIIGTGFAVQKAGTTYIWTAAHVMICENCEDADDHVYTITQRIEYQDVYVGRTSIPIEIVKVDRAWDIALLKSKITLPVPGVSFSSEVAEVGDPIFHIGNMAGSVLEGSLTFGHISKLNRNATRLWVRPLDQLDIVIMGGSSGGPIFNEAGEVIGILVGGFSYNTPGLMVPVRDVVEWARDNKVTFALWTGQW